MRFSLSAQVDRVHRLTSLLVLGVSSESSKFELQILNRPLDELMSHPALMMRLNVSDKETALLISYRSLYRNRRNAQRSNCSLQVSLQPQGQLEDDLLICPVEARRRLQWFNWTGGLDQGPPIKLQFALKTFGFIRPMPSDSTNWIYHVNLFAGSSFILPNLRDSSLA